MRPRKTENRDLPPGVYRRKRTSKSKKNPGKVGVSYFYLDKSGKGDITERVYRRVGALAKPTK